MFLVAFIHEIIRSILFDGSIPVYTNINVKAQWDGFH